ncbi:MULTISPECIES: thioredoxin domain-containing protein [unclassified Variovorax]|uniref:DsbA family protein n=1 Tax=unclassified Variovorax TaxID=663243 RepID=UPI001BD54785|nr:MULTISPECIES: thioredoxin domain-containing protein [unclassified Variovorax]
MTTAFNPASLLAVDPATDHVRGPTSARVTLVEYGDFECPSCRQAHSALKIVLDHFGNDLRFVFRHFPLREVHPHAELAAEAAEAAGAQHKFWQFHDLLFAHQLQLDDKHVRQYAQQAGLDMARFANEMSDHVYRQRVQEQIESGRRLGVRSTPSFYVNGAFCDVSFGLDHLHKVIDKALAQSGQ